MPPEIFFTADTHFDHSRIILPTYADRPYSSIEDMNEAFIENWNAVVKRGDFVFHLGDFGLWRNGKENAGGKVLKAIFNRLNGQKSLVIGNHDRPKETQTLGWIRPPQHFMELKVKSHRLVLSHYGLRVWPGMRKGAIHLYGHSHDRLPGLGNSLDVGVDSWNYRPVTLSEIRARLADAPPYQPETERMLRIDAEQEDRNSAEAEADEEKFEPMRPKL